MVEGRASRSDSKTGIWPSDALVALRRRPRRFTLPNGATVQIPKTAIDGLIEMLEAVVEGENATVVRTPREVSTQQAATLR